ncbi:hypothetical protein PFISCL1PPCAC_13082, partial [Pristionchus fissidentatus]
QMLRRVYWLCLFACALVAACNFPSITAQNVAASKSDTVSDAAHEHKPAKKSFKIAIFTPYVGNSQILFNIRVAEELLAAGHRPTLYMLHMHDMNITELPVDPRITVTHVEGSMGLNGSQWLEDQAYFAFNNIPVWDSEFRKAMARWGEIHKTCERFVTNQTFLAEVESQGFDLATTYSINACPLGIIHKTKIPAWVFLNSGALMDSVAEVMGVPMPPSYCPPFLMDAGEKLCFVQRVKSLLGTIMYQRGWRSMVADVETRIFRKAFGPDF